MSFAVAVQGLSTRSAAGHNGSPIASSHLYRFRGDRQLTVRVLTDIERSANGGNGRLGVL